MIPKPYKSSLHVAGSAEGVLKYLVHQAQGAILRRVEFKPGAAGCSNRGAGGGGGFQACGSRLYNGNTSQQRDQTLEKWTGRPEKIGLSV